MQRAKAAGEAPPPATMRADASLSTTSSMVPEFTYATGEAGPDCTPVCGEGKDPVLVIQDPRGATSHTARVRTTSPLHSAPYDRASTICLVGLSSTTRLPSSANSASAASCCGRPEDRDAGATSREARKAEEQSVRRKKKPRLGAARAGNADESVVWRRLTSSSRSSGRRRATSSTRPRRRHTMRRPTRHATQLSARWCGIHSQSRRRMICSWPKRLQACQHPASMST